MKLPWYIKAGKIYPKNDSFYVKVSINRFWVLLKKVQIFLQLLFNKEKK
jgi:hypothetical protein